MIEQLETDRQLAIAEVKQQVHEEMERKDKELAEVRSQGLAFKEENVALKEKTEKLEKAGINPFHYAPTIRRMRKGIKRCPCPSIRPCVLPFVHHLGRYFVSATPPTIFSQSF